MKFKDRIKSKSFWAGLIGAVFLILGAFGADVGDETAGAVINAVCSALVMLGIIAPSPSSGIDGEFDEDERVSDGSERDGENADGCAAETAAALAEERDERDGGARV